MDLPVSIHRRAVWTRDNERDQTRGGDEIVDELKEARTTSHGNLRDGAIRLPMSAVDFEAAGMMRRPKNHV
jgi:hypothetical protein